MDSTVLSKGHFTFELPLPEEIAEEYNVSPYPSVDKVILTGFFSDWDEGDENYLMVPADDDPKNQKWTASVILPPGEHQYKFAVYVKGKTEPLWTHDMNSFKQVYNGMNSYNSLVRIGRFSRMRQALQYVIYGLLLALIPHLIYLIFRRSHLKNIWLLLGGIILLSNSGFVLFRSVYDKQYYSFVSRSVISILENEMNRSSESVYDVFNKFLWHRMDKIGIHDFDSRFRYVSLLYFQDDYSVSDFDYRTFEHYHTINPLSLSSSQEMVFPYFKKQIRSFEEKGINEISYLLPASEKFYFQNHPPGVSHAVENGRSILQLSAKTYLFPHIEENRIEGYWGIFFSMDNMTIIDSYIIFNIGALLFFIAFIFILNLVRKENREDGEMLLDLFIKKYGISSRESDIIPYLMEGLTNKEIAEDLNISKRTVDNHVYNILHKAEAKNRVELIHLVKKGL